MNRRAFLSSLAVAGPALKSLESAPTNQAPPYHVGDLVRIRPLNSWDYDWRAPNQPITTEPNTVAGKTGIIIEVFHPSPPNESMGPSYSIHGVGAWFDNEDIELVSRPPTTD